MNPLSKFLKIVTETTTGPASYATGGFDVTVNDLSNVEFAVVTLGGGYIGEVTSISGNTLTVKAYSAAGTEVSAGTDLSSVNVSVIAFGV